MEKMKEMERVQGKKTVPKQVKQGKQDENKLGKAIVRWADLAQSVSAPETLCLGRITVNTGLY